MIRSPALIEMLEIPLAQVCGQVDSDSYGAVSNTSEASILFMSEVPTSPASITFDH
jgi:hypothetical protein